MSLNEKKILVGDLPYHFTSLNLKKLFKRAGQVKSASIIIDQNTGYSKGFGFVKMSNKEEAQKAIEVLNKYEIEGKKIIVAEARDYLNNF